MIAFRLAFSNHSQTIPLTILSGMPQHENRQTFSGNLAAIVATSLRVYSIVLNALGVLHEHNRYIYRCAYMHTIGICTNPECPDGILWHSLWRSKSLPIRSLPFGSFSGNRATRVSAVNLPSSIQWERERERETEIHFNHSPNRSLRSFGNRFCNQTARTGKFFQ